MHRTLRRTLGFMICYLALMLSWAQATPKACAGPYCIDLASQYSCVGNTCTYCYFLGYWPCIWCSANNAAVGDGYVMDGLSCEYTCGVAQWSECFP
jgi:hypothetical protein